MKALNLTIFTWLCVVSGSAFTESADVLPTDRSMAIESVATVLDKFHGAAAAGDWSTYFDLMSDDAVFIGSDVSERWSKSAFQTYAGKTDGWIYTLKTRNINLTPSGDSAWFDEILISKNYGTSRGTGIIPALLSPGESSSLLGDDATTPQFLDVVVESFLGDAHHLHDLLLGGSSSFTQVLFDFPVRG